MAIKPILFNTEMIRANLDGRKGATRRIMKPQPIHNGRFWEIGGAAWAEDITRIIPMPNHSLYNRAPYHPGDILYARENWAISSEIPSIAENGPVYMADFSDRELTHLKDKHFRWRPSIHMPKDLARLFCRVTDVRVERLGRMEIEDYIKEGVKPRPLKRDGCRCQWETEDCHLHQCTNRDAYEMLEYAIPFSELWDSTLSPADRLVYGHNANPWVWVIEYEKCEKPEETR